MAATVRIAGITASGESTGPAVKVRVGGAWVTAVPKVWIRGAWRIAIVRIRAGGAWT